MHLVLLLELRFKVGCGLIVFLAAKNRDVVGVDEDDNTIGKQIICV